MKTTTIPLTRHWTLVTKDVGLIQFNDSTRVAITSGLPPTEGTGFEFTPGSTYVNSQDLCVWARIKRSTTGVKSVRLAAGALP